MYQSTIGVLALIIVFLGWWILTHPAVVNVTGTVASTTTSVPAAADTTSTPATQTTSPTTSANGESVSVADQPASSAVAVSSLSLSQPGWVAIRDSNGRILGAAWFDTGSQSNVSVPLLRATTAGEKYQVLLYADNGDRQFDFHVDTLITNSDGSVPGTTFSAQ